MEDTDDLQRQINSLVVDGDSSPAIDQALAGTGFETLREYLVPFQTSRSCVGERRSGRGGRNNNL